MPNPSDSQVNQTTECVAKCPQGDGSEAQTNEFARCTQECIGKFYCKHPSSKPTLFVHRAKTNTTIVAVTAGGTPNPTNTADSKGPSGTAGSSSAKVTEVVQTMTDKDGKTTESTMTSTIASKVTGTGSSASSSSAPPDSAAAMVGPGVGLLAFVGALMAL